jgi:hypothetical protein
MFYCVLCEKETCYISKFCDKCRRIKHHLNLSGDRVYEVLDSVLSRTEEKQDNKIKVEIQKEIENKKYCLRSSKKVEGDETYKTKK